VGPNSVDARERTRHVQREFNMSRIAIVSVLLCALLPACTQQQSSSITPGAAKKHIQPGTTTQADVVEVFGTPNIITRKDGGEMWVYDKISSRTTSAAFGIGGLGGGGGGFGGGGLAGGVGSTERSETTVMLIIYFDQNDIVRDYKISQTKF
jgi:outer membrane protein assembly factor BamE (lipoprotein component of BamABCDE complex)